MARVVLGLLPAKEWLPFLWPDYRVTPSSTNSKPPHKLCANGRFNETINTVQSYLRDNERQFREQAEPVSQTLL